MRYVIFFIDNYTFCISMVILIVSEPLWPFFSALGISFYIYSVDLFFGHFLSLSLSLAHSMASLCFYFQLLLLLLLVRHECALIDVDDANNDHNDGLKLKWNQLENLTEKSYPKKI